MSQVLAEADSGRLPNTESKRDESPPGRSVLLEQARGTPYERWIVVIVLFLTALLYFVRIGARTLWASEFRWGEIAREMLLTRNYFWPTINGRVYFDKPLGSYWLIVASTWLTGRVNETAARIPGAAAGVLAVGLLILLARRLYDLRTGVVAGFILATSFSFAFWARTSSADVETVAGEIAVLLIFAKYCNTAGWWVVPMWLGMALTSLTKGLLGFVLPILVIAVYSCIAEGCHEFAKHLMRGRISSRIRWLSDRNRWFFNARTLIALPLAAALYCAPFAISHAVTGSTQGIYMVYRENVERYFAPFDHRGPIYLYAYVIFELMAPWSAFLPAALILAHRRAAAPAAVLKSDRFVLVFFWVIFVFFTLSGSRRSYYILPVAPAVSILIARVFTTGEKSLSGPVRTLLKAAFCALTSILILSAAVLLPVRALLPQPYSLLPMPPQPLIFASCWIISVLTIAYAWIRDTREQVLLSVGVTSYLMLFYLFAVAMPAGDRWRGEKQFAETTRHLIGGHAGELASFKTQPPVFYLGFPRPVSEYDTGSELISAIRSGHVKWIILRRRDISTLEIFARATAAELIFPWDSPRHRDNALVLMKVD